MPGDIPNEVVMARLSIQVAVVALESLCEKLSALPRTQKVLATAEIAEACGRLKSAQELIERLEEAAAK